MKTVCEINECAGCMACVDICPKESITIEDNMVAYNAIIQEGKCIDCGACYNVCQRNHSAQVIEPQKWFQGWASDIKVREQGTSGGVASEISHSFIEKGGLVCSCVFENGIFGYRIVDDIEGIRDFKGSKYVKSNPVGIYKRIRQILNDGKKVLFIGLPCQVSALRNYIGDKLGINLFTTDLICHGTTSPILLEKFLNQYGHSLETICSIQFREKDNYQVRLNSHGIITRGVRDKYLIAFLNSISLTENCYSCKYAKRERVSDLTLGDSWGSDLTDEEQKKGVSLVLCQTDKGLDLIKQSRLHLEYVDIKKAIANNHQLRHPSIRPKGRDYFFDNVSNGKKFNHLVFRYLPKQCLRQDIKEFLTKTNVIRNR